jgi:DNA-binding transcriptional LysR family regulator
MKADSENLKGYRRLIPSMTAIIEFEAVARLGSFTIAADELGVTQAAVSRQIKELEESVGVRLFHRLHRSIKLTAEGESLYRAVSTSLQRIAGEFDRLGRGAENQELVLVTTAAFSQFRLLPRLGNLRRLLPHVNLRLTTQMFTADLRHEDIDLAVRYGRGKWGDGTAQLLFEEEVFPVCSPKWLESHTEPRTLSELATAALIDYDSTSEGWMAWEEWFRAVGAKPSKLHFTLRCTLYTDSIQAALHGQGVALCWSKLLEELLESGDLVRLTTASVKVSEAYFVIVPHGRAITPTVQGVIDWLRSDVRD